MLGGAMEVNAMAGRTVAWEGTVAGVKPWVRVMRSFDQREDDYLGYVLRIRGALGGEGREFLVAVDEATHRGQGFAVGDVLTGEGVPVADARLETADLTRASAIEVHARGGKPLTAPPPFLGVAPALEVYRRRGARRLAARTFTTRCLACVWGMESAVEMIIDPWNPRQRRYRRETFCYGPKSCAFYRAGPTHKVPGRRGMSWEEADWVDEEATSHRGPDE
jgi:hypothetical protein